MDVTKQPAGRQPVWRQLVVAALGLVTTIVVSVVVALIEVKFGFALYSLSVLFVIPAGAFLVGMAAASGYYLGAVWLHQKPVGGILINMLLAAACAFWLVHYIPYLLLELDGKPVADYIPFWEYMDILIRSTSLTFSVHQRDVGTTGELGAGWGYAYTVLQLVGFLLGAALVFVFLKDKPFCNSCSKYLKTMKKTQRYTGDGEALLENTRTFIAMLASEQCREALQFHEQSMGTSKVDKQQHLCAEVTVCECPSCHENRVDFVIKKFSGRQWDDIEETKVFHQTAQRLTVA